MKTKPKHLGLALAGLLAIAGTAAAQDATKCAAEAVRMIPVYVKKAEYATAVAAADVCVKQFPKSAEVLAARGRAHTAAKNYDAAIADLTRVIELDGKSAAAYYFRGQAYRAQFEKDYQDKTLKELAFADFENALKIDPSSGITILRLAVLRRNDRETGYEIFIPQFNKAIDLLAKSSDTAAYAEAYYQRGYLYSIMQDRIKGNADFTRAHQIKPDYAAPILMRAGSHKLGLSAQTPEIYQ